MTSKATVRPTWRTTSSAPRPGLFKNQNMQITRLTGSRRSRLGTANSSIPVVGYFDANAPEEMAVFTIVNGQGVWSIASGVTPRTVTFGQAGDIPAPGNYDGLGYDQVAVYRPSYRAVLGAGAEWFYGNAEPLASADQPDLSSLVPVPGAYDNLAYFNSNQA